MKKFTCSLIVLYIAFSIGFSQEIINVPVGTTGSFSGSEALGTVVNRQYRINTNTAECVEVTISLNIPYHAEFRFYECDNNFSSQVLIATYAGPIYNTNITAKTNNPNGRMVIVFYTDGWDPSVYNGTYTAIQPKTNNLNTSGPITLEAYSTTPNLTITDFAQKNMGVVSSTTTDYTKSIFLMKSGTSQLGLGANKISSNGNFGLTATGTLYQTAGTLNQKATVFYFSTPTVTNILTLHSTAMNIGTVANPVNTTIKGNLTATKFIGDGSGLTGSNQWKTSTNGIYYGEGSGYVGIGEANPTANLEIRSDYDVPPVLRINYLDGNPNNWDLENNYDLIFKYGTSASTYTKVIFGANGNVGIGTPSVPGNKLEVVGTVKATKFIGEGASQWVNNGSNIYYPGSIGIGTSNIGNTRLNIVGNHTSSDLDNGIRFSDDNYYDWYVYPGSDEELHINKGGNRDAGVTLSDNNFTIGDFWKNGTTQLNFSISSTSNGYSVIQSYKTKGTASGELRLNPSGGNVGIGTAAPLSKFCITGPLDNYSWGLGNGWGDFSITNGTYGLAMGVACGGTGAGDAYIWTKGGSQKLTFGNPTNGEIMSLFNGSVGIGTNSPQANLHVKSTTSNAFLALDKASSSTEGGIQFRTANNVDFYLFSDNTDNGALKIEASGLTGEGDATPRIMIPKDNKNLNFAMSGGNVGIGTQSPRSFIDITNTSADMLKSVLARLSEGDASGEGTYLGVKSYNTTTVNGKSFAIEHKFYGQINSSVNFYRGTGYTGGFITFNTNDNTEKMRITSSGSVGIGIIDPGAYMLNVWGKIRAHEVVINTDGSDFVFEDTYKLRSLAEVETFIKQHKHLPEIAPASDMQANGANLGELQTKLLQKVEELTLYMIEQNKRNEIQSKQLELQAQEITILKAIISELKKENNIKN